MHTPGYISEQYSGLLSKLNNEEYLTPLKNAVSTNSKKWTQKTLTVCPGSSDPPEKKFNIFASVNEVYTIY